MIPAVVLLGGSSVYAARTWVQREVALRVDAQRQHDAASARPRDASTRFSTIVVAAKALPVGVELNRDALREIPWPAEDQLQGSFTTIAKLLEGKDKRNTLATFQANEPILARKITGPGQRPTLAASIEPGFKALTIRVDDVVGVAGFITPGDRVDVLLSRRMKESEAVADVVAQDVKVLGIDQTVDEEASKPKVARSVTVEVGTQDAQRLVVAQSVGALTLVLRRAGAAQIESSRRVTTSDLSHPARESKTREDGGQTTVVVTRNSVRQDYSVPRQGAR
ncbi:MAG: Flp pilus assembly protein CpaB [Methylobacteriaceae bacterium]|nr:Flp pilus assembly protein CpaB [Methylobacteriaceae bacterium]MCC0002754.1 Flp pilus assembly protein CpaB [Methylobacteriaceae bacterium]